MNESSAVLKRVGRPVIGEPRFIMKAMSQVCWLDLQRDKSSVIWKATSVRAGNEERLWYSQELTTFLRLRGHKGPRINA